MRPGTEPLVVVDDVTKTYHRGRPDEVRALRGVSVTVSAGEVLVIEGPSGSGKTSLLTVIGCMSRPTSGQVTIGDRRVSRLTESALTGIRRSTFGFIFQKLHLILDLSVEDNVMLPLVPTGMGAAEMKKRVDEALRAMRIEHRRTAAVGRISGGEQQRTAVARALVNAPTIIIADEPTAHLDGELSAELLAILGQLNDEGTTVVMATHDPRVTAHPAVHRRVVMQDGRIVEGGAG
ncbi:MAG: ABC transporter ATP-binding protein [Thermoanaerobaculales bacterium]|jgi:putative ABC transport system ATP-binding protein|nr:ABC transporter ATP-binding protein [Thermoanaerobaculales bacterium]